MQEFHNKFMGSAVVSEIQSSDMYLTLKARLFDLKANLNKVRVTEAFMDEIVAHEDKYVGIALYADIKGLVAKQPIGHMFNPRTGEFLSTQIGSFYHYEKEVDGDNAYLIGYARVMKRNKAVCNAIAELFENKKLNFSFELCCGHYEKDEDGIIVIDEHPSNYFEGEAIVSFPACKEAVALQLVAECLKEGGDIMTETEMKTETVEEQEQEQIPVDEAVEKKEIEACDKKLETSEELDEDEVEDKEELEELAEEPSEQKEEPEVEVITEEPSDEVEEANDETHTEVNEIVGLIAQVKELQKAIDEINKVISQANSEVKQEIHVAEHEEPALLNPFMGSIAVPKKYSLLETVDKPTATYTLFER